MVLRSGYGLFYGAFENRGGNPSLGYNYPFQFTLVYQSPNDTAPNRLPDGSLVGLDARDRLDARSGHRQRQRPDAARRRVRLQDAALSELQRDAADPKSWRTTRWRSDSSARGRSPRNLHRHEQRDAAPAAGDQPAELRAVARLRARVAVGADGRRELVRFAAGQVPAALSQRAAVPAQLHAQRLEDERRRFTVRRRWSAVSARPTSSATISRTTSVARASTRSTRSSFSGNYDLPGSGPWLGGWRTNWVLSMYSGQAQTINCSVASGAGTRLLRACSSAIRMPVRTTWISSTTRRRSRIRRRWRRSARPTSARSAVRAARSPVRRCGRSTWASRGSSGSAARTIRISRRDLQSHEHGGIQPAGERGAELQRSEKLREYDDHAKPAAPGSIGREVLLVAVRRALLVSRSGSRSHLSCERMVQPHNHRRRRRNHRRRRRPHRRSPRTTLPPPPSSGASWTPLGGILIASTHSTSSHRFTCRRAGSTPPFRT